MNLLFWNVQRLGVKTPGSAKEILEQVIAEAFYLRDAELALLCEMSASTEIGDVGVSKQVFVRKKGAHKDASQLGYAAIQDDLNDGVLEKYSPPKFTDVFGIPAWKKGGADFRKQSKRYVAYAGYHDAVNVYVYHANASGKAAFLVAWIAEALYQEHDGNFLLVGDLNCDPSDVANALQTSGSDPKDFRIVHGGMTHNAKTGVAKIYDYAVAGKRVSVSVEVLDISKHIGAYSKAQPPTQDMSDHLPIIVGFI